jgi:hypothetical protein
MTQHTVMTKLIAKIPTIIPHLYGKHWYYNTFVYILLILSPYSKLFFILERKNKLPRSPPFLPIRREDTDLLKLCAF